MQPNLLHVIFVNVFMLRILSLLLMNVFFSCEKQNVVAPPMDITNDTTITTPAKKDTIFSYLALGDSYTIGQAVQVAERYPVQATQLLFNDSIQLYAPEIIAQTGWTTSNLLSRINTSPPLKSTYDIVTLLIGVNNQYQGLSQSQYQREFTTLLNKAIQFANNNSKHVIVLSIPDYSVTPYAERADKMKIAMEIDAFNAINKEISLAKGVAYLDVTTSTRMASTDRSLIADDGLHPSGKEYAKWAVWLAPIIKNALKN
ncbi:SGNH/GDSL hydrolase family protein [Ferruginibacter lapsinanis]|uniref:SGNH/GDSL hydrolase family protein n=1 Tax=Ferruginibacter lapsinanis TaxID=563172 RepID=UPI001E34AAC7|nr:SGNH/GDSL hydrolase family protein [Ferruginibacter lapsinanis]UEG50821.1 SGNH/GDSL hydrolase family protein [Ferruginibacter lapsinanis]